MASAQSSVEINTEINTTGSSEERDRQVNAAMLMSCFSDETPPSTVPVTTGVGGTMEERVAAYKERKEKMKQQRKDKAARQAKEKEWFDLEMEKPYTEQQAIEEMLQHTIPQDWTSLRGSRDFQDQPPNHLYASNASEASSGSLSSTSSVSSNAQVVHEQELLKFLCVRRLLWFAFVTDSWALCCYGGAAGLGFAALENALYVGGGSLATALLRAGTAVPNHLMYGLLHGAFLSRRRFGHGGGRFSCCTSLLSPFLPMFLHGSHNFSIALCQYVNLRLGLAIMACVALTAVIILRLSMRNLEAQVNVQDLIDAKVVEAPACCFCCQGVCGWPVVWPPGAPVLAQLESEWCISHGLLRGLGNRTFELSDGGDKTQEAMVSTSLVGAATRNVFFETVIDQSTQDFRIGLRRGAETWTLSPAGFFHNNEQVEARPVSTECTLGCLLDWDASSLSFTEDGHELLSCTVDPAGPVGPAGPGQWILEWRAAGRLGIRLEHFQHSPEIDVQPLKQVSSQPGVGPVVGQVVGVILSESDE